MTALWTSRRAAPLALVLAGLALLAVGRFVDLSPRVEGDFFFAEDDPQVQASLEVNRRFPLSDQVVVRVEDRASTTPRGPAREGYRTAVADLTRDLLEIDGVIGGFSIATDNPFRSPLFRRLLLTPDSAATNVVVSVDETDPELLLPRIEAAVALHRTDELDIVASGVPVIVELIRRSLFRDLVVFSAAAVGVFALLTTLIYRDAAIVLGTLTTCAISVAATLLAVQGMGIGIGLLTANLITIVFVLTLSHVVFMTGNWLRAAGTGSDRRASVEQAVRDTLEGSFWSMATTLLGFASLLVATARPLRELGVAGVVGAATAILVAYVVYPVFLGSWARAPVEDSGGDSASPADPAAVSSESPGAPVAESTPATALGGPAPWALPVTALVVVVLGAGVARIDTDPGLLTYFEEGSELREGLARIDADGGSSTLDLVVADEDGELISNRQVFARLTELQAALEADSAVGVVLSPTVLIEHARTIPLAGLLPLPALLNIASSSALQGVALAFVTPDRTEARYSLRMRETVDEPRDQVTERIRGRIVDAGLRPVIVAGLYDLQAQLGRLIASSLRIGIGGLLLLFLIIAAVVSRARWATLSMWLCLAAIPFVTLGAFGHLSVALDLITSPAANIALAIGADSMIHLVVRARRLRAEGGSEAWSVAVAQIGPPVLGATTIVCAGFGIFALSSFPPTQRFGLAVIVGTATAAWMALVVLPRLVLVRSSTP